MNKRRFQIKNEEFYLRNSRYIHRIEEFSMKQNVLQEKIAPGSQINLKIFFFFWKVLADK